MPVGKLWVSAVSVGWNTFSYSTILEGWPGTSGFSTLIGKPRIARALSKNAMMLFVGRSW